jgi:transposase
MKTFVGIDYHKRFSYATIMAETGKILKSGRICNDPQLLSKFLGSYAHDDCVAVLEAGYNSHVMYDWLDELVDSVTLAHPGKLKAIAEAKVKTDKIDSALLAHLLRCDLIPAAHVSSAEARIGKQLLRHRMFLVRLSTMVKNRIHALVDGFPLLFRRCPVKGLFGVKGMMWLKSLEIPEHSRRILNGQINLLEFLSSQIKKVNKQLGDFGQSDERVDFVDSVPGIGKNLSVLIVTEIDEINRFSRASKLHSYAGLVPSTYSSGGRSFNGRITKQGNKYLRWAMIEAVEPASRKDAEIRRMYHRLSRRKGANSAKVAVARRLLTIVYKVLKERRYYRGAI